SSWNSGRLRMGTVFTFIGILLVSLLVAIMAALQLADFFNATQEIIVVLMLQPIFVVVSLVAFVIAYAAGGTRAIAATAIGLAVLALVGAPSAALFIADRATNPYAVV